MKKTGFALALLAGLAAGSAAYGQAGTGFTITDANVIFTRANTNTSGTVAPSTADFRVAGAASPDNVFRNYWWYRVDGIDTREIAFNNQTGPTVVAGNTATQTFAFPNFSAVLTYTVQSTGATFGQLLESVTVTNTASTPITLNLFNYTDFFFNGQDAGDSVALVNPTHMRVTDAATPNVMDFRGNGANRYEAGPFGSAVFNELNNASVNDLTNTVDSSVGDREGAFQWIVPLDVGGTAVISSRLAIVPAPAAAALLGLGGLVAGRRRRA